MIKKIVCTIERRCIHGVGDGRESFDESVDAVRLGRVRSSVLQSSRAATVAVVAVNDKRRPRVGLGPMDGRTDLGLDRRTHLQRVALHLLHHVRRLRSIVSSRKADDSNVHSRFAHARSCSASHGSVSHHYGLFFAPTLRLQYIYIYFTL